ncbi:MAG: DUF2252 domain-containing protein [Vulcanimicrobiaceae bacterium]
MLKLKTSAAQRNAALGKSLRAKVPRAAHAACPARGDDVDPLAIDAAMARDRLPYLLPVRHERMSENAFAFFRGAAAIMAADLAATPVTGIAVQLAGDSHCMNFGGFATPERNVIFDINDFDETLPGPWEWDIKRLATSIVLASRNARLRSRECDDATLATVAAYRTRMSQLAAMPALDVWYSRIDAAKILDAAATPDVRRRRETVVEHAAADPIRTVVDTLTETTDGAWRFRDDPPNLFHSHETHRTGFDIEAILGAYPASLSDDVAFLFSRYALVDHAIKVVGVGSVGTRCGIALLAADDHDPLLLQIKEARPSVLAAHLEPSTYANDGERVVRGQRLIQHASDVFLGWASSGDRTFYIRQFKDFKASANLDEIDGPHLRAYGEVCAYALAAGHARSGDAAAIAGYLGKSDVFDRALLAFARAYADRAESDYAMFEAASARELTAATA